MVAVPQIEILVYVFSVSNKKKRFLMKKGGRPPFLVVRFRYVLADDIFICFRNCLGEFFERGDLSII